MNLRTLLVVSLALATPSLARTWTSADGLRTLEGELISAAGSTATIKRADGKTFTLDVAKLSAADRDFIKNEAAKKPAASGAAAFTGPYASLIAGDWKQFEGKGGLEAMFFGGTNLSPSQRHPLVVYLHGKGNNVLSKEHLGFAAACAKPENQKERPCFILAPQCPNDNGWGGATGANLLKTLKDMMKTLPIDQDRVYLIGYSMGAYGVFDLLNQEPKLFAAGVPVAGGASPGIARNLRRVPLWVIHGAKDDVVPVEGSREIVKALERLRAPVKYTEHPEEGHGVVGKVTGDAEIHAWLFSQKRGG